jgi:hypothetical protein
MASNEANAELLGPEKLLLMAAAELGFGPQHGLSVANSAKVLRLAARWSGVEDSELRFMEGPHWHPLVNELFEALVRMVHQVQCEGPGRRPERPGAALFEGGGNWGEPGDPSQPPAWPLYTSCRLTELGEQIAQELLSRR